MTSIKESEFKVGEMVLAEHQVLIYEAKILDMKKVKMPHTHDEQYMYHIHYARWSSKYDEWVPAARIMKKNETNIRLKRAMDEESRRANKKRKSSGTSGKDKETVNPKEKDKDADEEEPALSVTVSGDVLFESLRIALVNDWARVSKLLILHNLPRTPNVATILKQFAESRHPGAKNPYDELASCLLELFDTVLSTKLLYVSERAQFDEAQTMKEGKGKAKKGKGSTSKSKTGKKGEKNPSHSLRPSDIYGGEHLLRLVVKLPEFLQEAQFGDSGFGVVQRELLEEEMGSLQSFLNVNAKKFFLQE